MIVVIEKSGKLKEVTIPEWNSIEMCKVLKIKEQEVKRHHVWSVQHAKQTFHIALYGVTSGKAGQENKYEFPPPMENLLFFGNCILVNQKSRKDKDINDLTRNQWKKIYTILFEGFEDLESEEESEDDVSGLEIDKYGYEKDGFVVDDDDEEIEEEEEEELSEIEEKPKKTKKSKKTKDISLVSSYLGCDSELEEELFVKN